MIAMLILQTVVCQYIQIGGIYPNLVFAFVMTVCVLEQRFTPVVVISVVCGVLLDALTNRVVGMYTIMLSFSAILCHEAVERFFRPGLPITLLCSGLCYFIGNCIYMLLDFTNYADSGLGRVLLFLLVPAVLYTTAASAVIYPLLRKTVYTGGMERGGIYD